MKIYINQMGTYGIVTHGTYATPFTPVKTRTPLESAQQAIDDAIHRPDAFAACQSTSTAETDCPSAPTPNDDIVTDPADRIPDGTWAHE